jgi:hypothetical protein
VITEELGEEVQARVRASREALAQTAHPPNVQESPGIVYRTTDPAWIEVIVRYLADPKKPGHNSSHLLKRLTAKLRTAPDSVRLPQGDAH